MTEITVPPLGESISEATVAKWLKSEGDAVKADETIAELETDKVTVEVNSPKDGIISEIRVKQGDDVEVGAVLGIISESNFANKTEEPPKTKQEQKSENKIEQPENKKPAPQVKTEQQYIHSNPDREERVRMTRLRQSIAKRLKDAQNNTAMLSTFNEADLSSVIDIRKEYREIFEKRYGVKLGFMSFFVKATVNALKEFPAVNARIEGDEIVYNKYYDIGVAVSTPQGLVVPVLRDADKKSIAETEKAVAELGARAKNGDLAIEELKGGTFTITNGGIFGSMLSTPIINYPQSAILGMHTIQQRPVVLKDGSIEARPMMYLALSYDHRIIDGKEAVGFLVKIKEAIEDPQRLLIGV